MTTPRPSRARKAALPAETPAEQPAATEAPETPGAAPDAAPGPQEGPAEHEPALDEAEPYDFAAHARRIFSATWPAPDAPVVLTADALKGWSAAAASTAQATTAALAEVDRDYQAALRNVHGRLDDWLQMRSRRFPAHAREMTSA